MTDIHLIAQRLVALLKEKKFLEAQKELYAPEATNIEPEPVSKRSVAGLEAMLLKEKTFLDNIKKWNNFEVSEPLVSKDYFSLRMITDVVLLNDKQVLIDEIIVYQVMDGKIVKEQFFYNP